jgi:hypothetical protein
VRDAVTAGVRDAILAIMRSKEGKAWMAGEVAAGIKQAQKP